jgi:hypothetical protein
MTDTPAAVETPASELDAMGAIFDKLTADGIEPEPVTEEPQDGVQEEKAEEVTQDETSAEAEEAETQEQKPAPSVEAPTDLPASIRAKWADMPEEARDAVLSSHRDLTRKMADQGRVVQASKPVYDVLVQAAQEIPTLKDMTPAQIAADVFKMAQIQGQLAANPVQTLLGIAKQYGALEGIQQALQGQAPSQAAQDNIALVQEVRQLRAMLQNTADPQAIDQRIQQTLTVRDAERMVAEYAAQKEYWGEVEPIMPTFIPMAQQMLGAGASQQDVLDAAYDMAIHARPDLRTKVSAPAKPAQAQPDPKRTQAQLNARSVNVKPAAPSQFKPKNERDAMSQAYDRLVNQ